MILAAATVMLLFACNKNTPDEVAPRFAIVQSHLEVAPDGGDCTIEVEADQAAVYKNKAELAGGIILIILGLKILLEHLGLVRSLF